MASIFNQGESRKHNHFVDPFSQREMTIIDYIFKCRPGQPEIICLIDDIDIFGLNSSLNMQELTTRIRDFTGALFVLSNKMKNKKIPLEFMFTLGGCPRIEIFSQNKALFLKNNADLGKKSILGQPPR
ncbi:hypothetical protein KAI46_08085 [bacterium]|nr:hypothetical protein [bacterium]